MDRLICALVLCFILANNKLADDLEAADEEHSELEVWLVLAPPLLQFKIHLVITQLAHIAAKEEKILPIFPPYQLGIHYA